MKINSFNLDHFCLPLTYVDLEILSEIVGEIHVTPHADCVFISTELCGLLQIAHISLIGWILEFETQKETFEVIKANSFPELLAKLEKDVKRHTS